MTLTAFENEHIKHVTVGNISSITANDMTLKSDWKVFVDGEQVINEVYDKERYIRISDDYENDIIGTWEGKVTSSEDEHTDGELHWKKTIDSNELREWWEIESIKDGVMKWKALRMREDGTTYTATFEMTKVQ